MNMTTHDLKYLILPVRVCIVVDDVLYTEPLYNLKLRVRRRGRNDRGTGSESNLSTKATKMSVYEVYKESTFAYIETPPVPRTRT